MLAIKIAIKKTLCSLNFHILLQEYQFVHIFCQEARPTCSDYVPSRWENTSLGTDVPWTARLRWANLAMWGYLCSLLFHHASGSSSTEMQPVALYEVTSSWMMSDKGFVLLSSVLKKCVNTIAMADFFLGRRGLWWPWLRSWGWTGRLGFTALTLMSIWQNRHFGNVNNNK